MEYVTNGNIDNLCAEEWKQSMASTYVQVSYRFDLPNNATVTNWFIERTRILVCLNRKQNV